MTVETRDKLTLYCLENDIDKDRCDKLISILDNELMNVDYANQRATRELQRKYENGQKAYTDAHLRFNSKIMSVYYLLDTVSDTGTHHEKKVIIMYLKSTLQKMVHNGDPLPFDPDLLPF